MPTWIALFRGINVGGNNILPMAELREDLESMKLTNVRTYIQSGNVVFEATAKQPSSLGKKISRMVAEKHGFEPQLFIISSAAFMDAIETNPFPKAISDPKTLHFFFLEKPARKADLKALDAAKKSTEKYVLTDQVFYLHAPDGIGRSKLAANAEKHLGVATTARNFRTVDKINSMIS